MAVVLDDMPPLMWHAELGRGLVDVWSGKFQRGVQLHDLRAAVERWVHDYGQRPWLRQLDGEVTGEMEDAVLRTVARMDGTPFPSTAALAGRWLRGRVRRPAPVETTYCAELVAATYQAMGLLGTERPSNYYDPGMFWSGDDLRLLEGARLGEEIRVDVPPRPGVPPQPARSDVSTGGSGGEAAVAFAEEQQRLVGVAEPEVLHPADDDVVVSGLVDGLDRAVDVAEDPVEQRRTGRGLRPRDAVELVGAF